MGGVKHQYLVSNEAMSLMSLMRKSNKWVHSGISAILGTEDEPLAQRMGLRTSTPSQGQQDDLLQGFAPLCNPRKQLNALEIIEPFLRVVQSPQTSGSLTLRALISVEKLMVHVFDHETKDISKVLYKISFAVTHCRFEARDHAENDAVLHQIMAVMTTIVCGSMGDLLSNQALCEVVETCLSMACHMRRGELLLRNARLTLTRLLITAFKKMPAEPKVEPLSPPEHLPDLVGPLKEAVSLESRSQTPMGDKELQQQHQHNTLHGHHEPNKIGENNPSEQQSAHSPPSESPEPPISYEPFDSNGLLQIYHVMISLLEPSSKYSDKTRLMVIQLLCHVFETAGESMANDPRFIELTSSQLFKFVSQILRSNSPPLLAESIRLFNLIIESGQTKYILQLQFVLTYLLRCLSPLTDLPRDANIDSMFYDGVPSRPKCVKMPHTNHEDAAGPVLPLSASKSPEIREIMVEAIARMVHTENFFTKLFTNYDCDIQQQNLCEDLIGFLCRNAYPDTATWSTASVPPLCLESILSLLASLHDHMDDAVETEHTEQLLAIKSRKGVEIRAAELFNEKPHKGIEYAIKEKVIESDTPKAIADFLYSSQRLNGATLGDYLAKRTDVYDAFLRHFDFTNQRIDEAMRELLAHFRLPGESGPIEKLLDGLGEYYIGLPHDVQTIQTKDAAFVLSYAIIMLNTNLYNPQVKDRMTLKQFQSQLKGSNNGDNFSEEYVEGIYNTISRHEMIFPAEHDNDESFERGWNDLQLVLGAWSEPAGIVDTAINKEIFNVMWKPIVSTLAFIFATATDDLVFSRVITGIQKTAAIAARFGTENALDHIIECLGKISILSSGDLAAPLQNIEVKIASNETGAKHSVIVSDLSVAFGSDLKAQMASITLFRIIRDVKQGRIGTTGWEVIARTLTNLYLYDLIEPLKGVDRVDACYTFEWSNSGKNVGIFSALSSYLTAAADTPAEPSDDDVDAALSAQDCIKICEVPSVIEAISDRASESGLAGIEAALPDPTDGERYMPAILFLSQLMVRLVGSDKSLKAHALELLERLPASSSAKLSGSVTNLLLQIGSLDKTKLDVNGMNYFIDSLLEYNDLKVWTFLSEAPIEEIQDKEKLHQFIANKNNYDDKQALEPMLRTVVKVADTNPEAIDILYEIKDKHVKNADEFFMFADVAITPCASPNVAVREKTLDRLQSFLQTYDILNLYNIEWQSIFTRGLIPLIDILLKPQVFKRDPKHMDATRQRSASIACKTFLVYAMQDDEHMLSVWLELLNVMDRLLSSRKQPSLHEGIGEMIKNVILVLQMSEKGNEEFWQETQRTLKDWMPELAQLVGERAELKDAE